MKIEIDKRALRNDNHRWYHLRNCFSSFLHIHIYIYINETRSNVHIYKNPILWSAYLFLSHVSTENFHEKERRLWNKHRSSQVPSFLNIWGSTSPWAVPWSSDEQLSRESEVISFLTWKTEWNVKHNEIHMIHREEICDGSCDISYKWWYKQTKRTVKYRKCYQNVFARTLQLFFYFSWP